MNWRSFMEFPLSGAEPIYKQIEIKITSEISIGRLGAGKKMPGSRELAAFYRVNRNTIVHVYENLIAKGWLVPVERQGTFVAGTMPGLKENEPSFTVSDIIRGNFAVGSFEESKEAYKTYPKQISFNNDCFPADERLYKKLSIIYKRLFYQYRWQSYYPSSAVAFRNLTEVLVLMFREREKAYISSGEICFLNSGNPLFYLLSSLLNDRGESVIMFSPGDPDAHAAFQYFGADISYLNPESESLIAELIEICKSKPVKLFYLEARGLVPTNVLLPEKIKVQLLALSAKYKFYIVEADYDFEFKFSQERLETLADFGTGRVIRLGVVSKLSPQLRELGFIKGPAEVVAEVKKTESFRPAGDSVLYEAIAEALKKGILHNCRKKQQAILQEKHDSISRLLHRFLSDKVKIVTPIAGFAFWIVFKEEINVVGLIDRLKEEGILIQNPAAFYLKGEEPQGIRLETGTLKAEDIERGLCAIDRLLHKY